MLLDVTQTLASLTGEPLTDDKGKPLTLRDVCATALVSPYPDEQHLAGTEKVKRWELATRIVKQDKVELAAEDVARLKELVGKAWGVVVVGPAWELLDPQPKLKIAKE